MMNYTSILLKQKENITIQTINECIKIKFFGIYLTFIFIAGASLNSSLLCVFYMKKELRTPLNKLFIALTVINLIGCVTEIPLVIFSSFNCK